MLFNPLDPGSDKNSDISASEALIPNGHSQDLGHTTKKETNKEPLLK